MGPQSKDAVVSVLGHILDELEQQRGVIAHKLGELRSALESHHDSQNTDLAQVNQRVSDLERAFSQRGFNGAPPAAAPAE
jgi:flagellar motility protein MotE (MotC chaperone)